MKPGTINNRLKSFEFLCKSITIIISFTITMMASYNWPRSRALRKRIDTGVGDALGFGDHNGEASSFT